MYQDVYGLSVWTVYLAFNCYGESYIGCTTNKEKTNRQLISGKYISRQDVQGYRDNCFSILHSEFVGSFIEAHKFKRWLLKHENPKIVLNREGLKNFRKNILPMMEDSTVELKVRNWFFIPDSLKQEDVAEPKAEAGQSPTSGQR